MESNDKIKIMIVGDYLIFRNGLKMLIESRKDFKVIGEVSTLSEVEGAISKNRPYILIIDSNEIENGEFEKFLSTVCDGIPTLVLTNSKSAKTHQKFLLLGASGVVTKEQDPNVLFKAIERVNSDDLWFKREVMKNTIERLIKEKNEAPEEIHSDKFASLTDREKEVLTSICKGMKNKEIAESLFITETTVRHHLTSIFEKLNVKSRLNLAILAFNERLVDVPPKDDKPA
ncbi:MAG: response regulator transcription factor [Pyrinomonadaceae bacterium]